ncbi:DUF6801 domain-containing protein [Amycolatopsis anabasis]|uniref:DUF6801 domain-containing protein n=1 Tax=Amycolatopsis anabasis TaxID=1840409 RepID=UPI00131BF7E2|nr:DUF6801 domain-containing protein [Amycolatopsis anabasis]
MTRRMPRSRFVLAAAVVGLAAGFNSGLAGAGSGAPGSSPGLEPVAETVSVAKLLAYDCALGEAVDRNRVTAAITTTAPAWVRAGKSVRFGQFSAEFTFPEQLRPALGTPASVEGRVKLGLSTRQAEVPFELPPANVPLPETGPLSLVSTGAVPPVDAGEPGELAISLAPPAITFGLKQADGTPSAPPEAGLACALAADQDPLLAKVSVVRPGAEPAPAPESGQPGTAEVPGVPGTPGSPLNAQAQAAAARNVTFFTGQAVSGKSAVVKLQTSMRIGPGLAPHVSAVTPGGSAPGQLYTDSALPKSASPFYAFGFMPTTGSAEFLPPDDPNGKLTSLTGTLKQGVLEIMHTEAIIKLSDVLVNGVPLDVGPNCRTETPVKVAMASVKGGTYTVFKGGNVGTIPDSPNPELRGFTIPPFTGCGTTSDLSPLVTGLVSGPGNQIELTLTPLTQERPAQ